MKKSSVSLSSHSLGTFPSPGATDFGSQKGWYSERVPHPACSRRRYVNAAALTPFYSGRTLPSKWEDAERWICSPVSGYGGGKKTVSQQTHKSKSGPLGPPAAGAYYSPAVPVASPFSTGVFGADGLSVYYCGGGGVEMEKNVARSISGPGWSDLLSESYSLPSSQGEYIDDVNKDEENLASRAVSRRDMATQMSPESSTGKEESPLQFVEEGRESDQTSKLEVRDVQVDKRTTVINWSSRHGARARASKKQSPDVEDLSASRAVEARSSSWTVEEAAKDVSKLYRDEAKITAWENLQKAKAEAAIRKLEMKLEKKRSATMDKIMKELRATEVKAQKMRSSTSGAKQDKKITDKTLWFRRHAYLMGCFTCQGHAF